MPRNVEVKLRVISLDDVRQRLQNVATSGPAVIRQTDTFFNASQGRLKLRIEDPSEGVDGKLFHYDRSDIEGPKLSDYREVVVQNAMDMKEILRRACGIVGEVVKNRELYMIGQTRIHLDSVVGLGCFVELEVQLKAEQAVEEGEAIAHEILKQLNLTSAEHVRCAYMDLLLGKQ